MASSNHPNYRAPASLPPELRRVTIPSAVLAWVQERVGDRVVGARRLAGASTTAVHRLRLAKGTSVVVRRYVWAFVLDDDPLTPEREIAALGFAAAAGLTVPEVIAADVSGNQVGDGTPTVLMAYLPGRAVAVPDLGHLAELAATIHAVDPAGFPYEYSDWFGGPLRPPRGAATPALWEQAAELVATVGPRPHRTAFIHRDFHPGNVLWPRGRPPGVVDWAHACAGPSGCDVAHCRGNLVRLAGFETAEEFRAAYEAVTGDDFDPYWDLADVFEHGPSPWDGRELSEAKERLAPALAELGYRSTAAGDAPAPRRPPADWNLDTGTVARLVDDQFPELDTSYVRPVGGGWDNEVYLVDSQWAFRFPRRAEAVPWLERERQIMATVAAALPGLVPQFRWLGQPTDDFPHPFVGYRWLPGVPAHRAKDLAALAADLGAALSALHEIDPAGIPPTPPRWEDQPWDTDAAELAAVAHRLEPMLSPSLLGAARPYLRAEIPAPANRGPRRLIHNDLVADHVLVDPATGRLAGITDFGDAMVDDPVLDFVGLITIGDRHFVAQVLQHYTPALPDDLDTKFDWLSRVLTLRWLADAVLDDVHPLERHLAHVAWAHARTTITSLTTPPTKQPRRP